MTENRRPSGNTPPEQYEGSGRGGAAEDPQVVIRRLQGELFARNAEIRRLNAEKSALAGRIDEQTMKIVRMRARLDGDPLIEMQLLSLDLMTEAVMIADASGLLIYGNAASEKMFGSVDGANVHSLLFEGMRNPYAASSEDSVVRNKNLPNFGSELWGSLRAGGFVRERVMMRVPSIQEAWYDVSLVMRQLDWQKGCSWMLIEILDIGLLNKCELTGLYRREVAINALRRETALRQREPEGDFVSPLSAAFIDLDDFKQYNEVYGYAAGNKVLRSVGEVIDRIIRKTDVGARWGGDEFLIILPNGGIDEAARVGERLNEGLTEIAIPWRRDGFNTVLKVSASIGVVEYRRGDTWEDLERRAQVESKNAKGDGKACVSGRYSSAELTKIRHH